MQLMCARSVSLVTYASHRASWRLWGGLLRRRLGLQAPGGRCKHTSAEIHRGTSPERGSYRAQLEVRNAHYACIATRSVLLFAYNSEIVSFTSVRLKPTGSPEVNASMANWSCAFALLRSRVHVCCVYSSSEYSQRSPQLSTVAFAYASSNALIGSFNNSIAACAVLFDSSFAAWSFAEVIVMYVNNA
jgi:hypothetical protein